MEEQIKEKKSTVAIYERDLRTVKDFYEKHPQLNSLADAVRVAVEFTNAHGGFQ